MLDTVILNFFTGKFRIPDLAHFGTLRRLVASDPRGYAKYECNMTREEKKNNIYMPNFTLYKRGKFWWLKAQFSCQKLLFGNSVDEVEEKDFEAIVSRFQECLEKRSIFIDKEDIRNTSVSSFHPAKNIVISGGYRVIFIIHELAKVNLTEKMEMDHKHYKNNGHALQYYSKVHSFVMYDKGADNRKSSGTAIEKNRMPQQLDLFKYMAKKHIPLELLRLEVRLSEKRKMNQVLKKLWLKKDPMFRDIFKKDVCQKVVQMYWQHFVTEKHLFLFDMASGPQATLRKLIKINKGIKPKDALYRTVLAVLARDEDGIRGLRAELSKICDRRTWYRIANDFKLLNKPQKISNYHGWVKDIEDQLEEFKSYKLPKFDL